MSYNLLKGKKGLIFGALNEQSIAWKVAERAVEEGAEIASGSQYGIAGGFAGKTDQFSDCRFVFNNKNGLSHG